MEMISKADWEQVVNLAREIAGSPNHSLHAQAVFLLQAVESGDVTETEDGFSLRGCALQNAYKKIHGDRHPQRVWLLDSG